MPLLAASAGGEVLAACLRLFGVSVLGSGDVQRAGAAVGAVCGASDAAHAALPMHAPSEVFLVALGARIGPSTEDRDPEEP
jgi:hypothetical protein